MRASQPLWMRRHGAVEAEQDPKKTQPKKLNAFGHRELIWVMAAAGYEVVS